MSTFAQSISLPVGGCFIATLIMLDILFMNQKPESYSTVSDLKLNVFKAFKYAFDVEKLDFLISLSSLIGLIGNPVQTSYAA